MTVHLRAPLSVRTPFRQPLRLPLRLDLRLPLALAAAGSALPAWAGSLTVNLELPRVPVPNYRPPYVAVWIETPEQTLVANLAVWYDLKKRNNAGTKWLNEVRSWWRASGRGEGLAAEGVSGPTRPPGAYALAFAEGQAPTPALPPGNYVMVVEAAREHGGDEVARLPFSWPPKGPLQVRATGQQELGSVSLELRP